MTNDDGSPPTSRRVPDSLVMPFANVRHLGFRDKVGATRLAGFGQLSLHPHEARDTIKGGLRPQDMLEIAAENGVAIAAAAARRDPGTGRREHRLLTARLNRSLSPVSQGDEISVSRVFDAPRELVYRAFVDPDQLGQWFGPAGFSVPMETVQSDVRTGGFQRFVLVSDADPSHRASVEVAFSQVVEDELLVAHADIGGIAEAGTAARIRLRLEFLDQPGDKTRLELRQDASRHELCTDPEAAWETSFIRLDSLLQRSR